MVAHTKVARATKLPAAVGNYKQRDANWEGKLDISKGMFDDDRSKKSHKGERRTVAGAVQLTTPQQPDFITVEGRKRQRQKQGSGRGNYSNNNNNSAINPF